MPGSADRGPTPRPSRLRGPLTVGSRIRSSSSSMADSISTPSLAPPAANTLMPLSANGLCDAEMTTAGTSRSADSQARAGVGRTPTSTTSAPSLARPADRAAWSIGPERRVSRPTRKVVAVMWRAMARPRASTSSGVRSTFATPRTPSVPNRVVTTGLPLGVLGSLACLLQAVLLRLLLTRVTREESRLLECAPQLGVELAQGPGDAQSKGAGLARHAAAHDGHVDVPRLGGLGETQRLGDDHPVGGRGEVLLEGVAVDGDGSVTGADPDPGDRLLAASGGLADGGGVGHSRVPRFRFCSGPGRPRRLRAAPGRRGATGAREVQG